MSSIEAVVKGGRLVLDEPTELPEGTVVHLAYEMTADELSKLDAALARSAADVGDGRVSNAADVIGALRAKRR